MPLSDFLSDTISSLGESIKKLPTSTLGGAVDLGNMVLGGYAGILEAAQGKKISRSMGEGLVKKPTGGSEQLNDVFGISNSSNGLIEDSASAMLSALNPAAALKTAMIVPAMLLKSGKTIALAEAALNKGKSAAEVFGATGVYKDPADGMLKAVMDDSKAALKTSARPLDTIETYNDASGLVRTGVGPFALNSGPSQLIGMRADTTLDKVIDHPALFEAIPDLAKIKVSANTTPGIAGAYNPSSDSIKLTSTTDANDLLSVILHETQHAVQDRSGFASGSSSAHFFRDLPGFKTAVGQSNEIMTELNSRKIIQGDILSVDVLEQRNANKMSSVLKNANAQATTNYMNTAGEVEARHTQKMFETNDYSTLPLDLEVGQTGRLISDPLMGNKVDNDPMVKAVVSYLNDLRNMTPGK